ncbi:MAG TPA: hypothetical protein VFC78_07315 [Tepidisphaeraceae bacterium]|nr:hypothetical protein [Tepidisphaeraceae bacterium]
MKYQNWIGTALICAASMTFNPLPAKAQNAPADSHPSDAKANAPLSPREQYAIHRSETLHAQQNYIAAMKDMQTLREQLQANTGRTDVSPEGLGKAIRWLEEQRESLELEAAGLDARRIALAEAVQEASHRSREAAAVDSEVRELTESVKAQTAANAQVEQMYKTGVTGKSDVEKARATLANARASLEQARREAALRAGGSDLALWNRELLNSTITQREQQARLRYIQQKLERLRANMQELDELAHREQAVRAAEAQLQEAARQAGGVAHFDSPAESGNNHPATQPASR